MNATLYKITGKRSFRRHIATSDHPCASYNSVRNFERPELPKGEFVGLNLSDSKTGQRYVLEIPREDFNALVKSHTPRHILEQALKGQ